MKHSPARPHRPGLPPRPARQACQKKKPCYYAKRLRLRARAKHDQDKAWWRLCRLAFCRAMGSNAFMGSGEFNARSLPRTRKIVGTLCLLSCLACQERRPAPTGGARVGKVGAGAPKPAAKKSIEQLLREHPPEPEPEPAPSPPPPSDPLAAEEEAAKSYSELSSRWGALVPQDLGPAAPVSATSQGALFITHQDQMFFSQMLADGSFTAVDLGREQFAKYGRGPAVSASHAYWASERGQLMRGNLKTRKVEVIHPRARPGTRTSVVTYRQRDIVAFVVDVNETPVAFVWASPGKSGAETLRVSPEGSSATSIALVAGAPHPRLVILEGRTSMSPVHVTTVRVTPRRVTLAADEVVWIGPGSHVLTEIHAIDTKGGNTTAFLPTAKDFHDFGLAQLFVDADGGEAAEPGWQIFPNGLDPAPLAVAHFCGGEYVLFARPSEEHPRSPQELHLAPVAEKVLGSGDLIARSRAFNDISLAPLKGGALAVWTADRRTWGTYLACPK